MKMSEATDPPKGRILFVTILIVIVALIPTHDDSTRPSFGSTLGRLVGFGSIKERNSNRLVNDDFNISRSPFNWSETYEPLTALDVVNETNNHRATRIQQPTNDTVDRRDAPWAQAGPAADEAYDGDGRVNADTILDRDAIDKIEEREGVPLDNRRIVLEVGLRQIIGERKHATIGGRNRTLHLSPTNLIREVLVGIEERNGVPVDPQNISVAMVMHIARQQLQPEWIRALSTNALQRRMVLRQATSKSIADVVADVQDRDGLPPDQQSLPLYTKLFIANQQLERGGFISNFDMQKGLVLRQYPSMSMADVISDFQEKSGVAPDQNTLALRTSLFSAKMRSIPLRLGITKKNGINAQPGIGGRALAPGMVPTASKMQVFVKTLRGKHITLNVNPSITVDDLRSAIKDREGVPPKKQRLTFNKQDLDGNRLLSSYSVEQESTISLNLRGLGGTKDRKVLGELTNKNLDGRHQQEEERKMATSVHVPSRRGPGFVPHNLPLYPQPQNYHSMGQPLPPYQIPPMSHVAASRYPLGRQSPMLGTGQLQRIGQQVAPRKQSLQHQAGLRHPAAATSDGRKSNGRKRGEKNPRKDDAMMKGLLWKYVTGDWPSQRKFLESVGLTSLQSTFNRAVRAHGLDSFRQAYKPGDNNPASSVIAESVKDILDKAYPDAKSSISPKATDRAASHTLPSRDEVGRVASSGTDMKVSAAMKKASLSRRAVPSKTKIRAPDISSKVASSSLHHNGNILIKSDGAGLQAPSNNNPIVGAIDTKVSASPLSHKDSPLPLVPIVRKESKTLRLPIAKKKSIAKKKINTLRLPIVKKEGSNLHPKPLSNPNSNTASLYFGPLTEDISMNGILLRANKVLSADGTDTHKTNLGTLEHGEFLDDEVLNAVFHLVANEFEGAYAVNTHFWTLLTDPRPVDSTCTNTKLPSEPILLDGCTKDSKAAATPAAVLPRKLPSEPILLDGFTEDSTCKAAATPAAVPSVESMEEISETTAPPAAERSTNGWNGSKHFFQSEKWSSSSHVPVNAPILIIPVHSDYGDRVRNSNDWVQPQKGDGHWSVIIRVLDPSSGAFKFYYRDSLNDSALHPMVEKVIKGTGLFEENRGDKWNVLASAKQREVECGAAAVLNAFSTVLDLNSKRGNGERYQRMLRLAYIFNKMPAKLTRAWVKKSLLDKKLAPLDWLEEAGYGDGSDDEEVDRSDSTDAYDDTDNDYEVASMDVVDQFTSDAFDDDVAEPDYPSRWKEVKHEIKRLKKMKEKLLKEDKYEELIPVRDNLLELEQEASEIGNLLEEVAASNNPDKEPRHNNDGSLDGRINNGPQRGYTYKTMHYANALDFIMKWYTEEENVSFAEFCRANHSLLQGTKVGYNTLNTVINSVFLDDGSDVRNNKRRKTNPEQVKRAVEAFLQQRRQTRESNIRERHEQNRFLKSFEDSLLINSISELSKLGHPPTVEGVKRVLGMWNEHMNFNKEDKPEPPCDATVRRLINRSDELTISARASSIDIKRAQKASPETGRAWFLKILGQHSLLFNDPTVNMPRHWKTMNDVDPECIFNYDELAADTNARYDRVVANAENLRIGLRLWNVVTNGDDKKQAFHVTIGMFTSASGRYQDPSPEDDGEDVDRDRTGAPPPIVIHSRPGRTKKKEENIEPSIFDKANIEQIRRARDGSIQYYNKHGLKVLTTKNGSMEQSKWSDLVDHFLEHLPPHIGPGKHQKPCFLFVDGHASRWDWAEILRLRMNGVHLLVLPSHTSVWSQPNDVGPNKRLHSHIKDATSHWIRTARRNNFERRDFNSIFVRAWEAFMNTEHRELLLTQTDSRPGSNAASRAYEKTGLYPFDPDCSAWSEAVNTLGMKGLRQASPGSFVRDEIVSYEPVMYTDMPEMTREDADYLIDSLPNDYYTANLDSLQGPSGGIIAALKICKGIIQRYKQKLKTNDPDPEPQASTQPERLVLEKYFRLASSLDPISPEESREEVAAKAKKRQKTDIVQLTNDNGVIDVKRISDGREGIAHKISKSDWVISFKLLPGKQHESLEIKNEDLINDKDFELKAKRGDLSLREKRGIEKRKSNDAAAIREQEANAALEIAKEERSNKITEKVQDLIATVRGHVVASADDAMDNDAISTKVHDLVSFIETPYCTSAGNHEASVGPEGLAVPSLTSWIFGMAFGGPNLGGGKGRGRGRTTRRRSRGNTPSTEFGATTYDLMLHRMGMISDQNLVAEFDLAEVARKEAEEKWTLIQACMDIDDARSESNDWFSVSGAQPKLVKSELATLARVFGLHVKRSKGKGVPLLTDYQRAIRELQLNRVMFENRVETLYNEWLNTIGTTDESMNEALEMSLGGSEPTSALPAHEQHEAHSQITSSSSGSGTSEPAISSGSGHDASSGKGSNISDDDDDEPIIPSRKRQRQGLLQIYDSDAEDDEPIATSHKRQRKSKRKRSSAEPNGQDNESKQCSSRSEFTSAKRHELLAPHHSVTVSNDCPKDASWEITQQYLASVQGVGSTKSSRRM